MQEKVPEHPRSGKSVCAELVSFHPDSDLPARVSRTLAQVGALVIVDNGSNEAALRMLEELSADARTCKRIALYEDRKLSKIAAVVSGWWDGVRGHLGPRHRAGPG